MEGWRLGSIWLEKEDKREGGGVKRVEAEGREGLTVAEPGRSGKQKTSGPVTL